MKRKYYIIPDDIFVFRSARVSSLVRWWWWCNKLEGMKLHRRTLFPLIYQRRPSYDQTYVNQENINHKPRSDIYTRLVAPPSVDAV